MPHKVKYQRATQIPMVGDEPPRSIIIASLPIRATCCCGWEGRVFTSFDGDPQQLARDDYGRHQDGVCSRQRR